MSLRLSGTDPFLRASIGAFNGYGIRNSASSAATLLKRNAASAWNGIHVIDDGGSGNEYYAMEFNPSDQLVHAINTGDGGRTGGGAGTFNNTTSFMIVGYTWNGTTGAGQFIHRWKIGAAAWASETDTSVTNATALTAGDRHLIGNEAALGDDANFDWVCSGLIKSNLSQATFESLNMTDIASWDAVFTGAGAWLLDGEAIGSRTDRTGNGGNETSRSGSVTLQADPAGWSWGGAAAVPTMPLTFNAIPFMGRS